MSSHTTNQQTLAILLERATGQRDEAQRALQDLLNRAEQARAQHGQLSDYRGEYQQRWSQQFANHADQRVTRARESLLELETHVAAITKLMERRRLEVSRAQQRQDQKTTDEQAARASLSGANPYSRLSA